MRFRRKMKKSSIIFYLSLKVALFLSTLLMNTTVVIAKPVISVFQDCQYELALPENWLIKSIPTIENNCTLILTNEEHQLSVQPAVPFLVEAYELGFDYFNNQ